jgi:hypothetical protein
VAKDNHHYIPQGYLRRFSIEGEKSLIWEYDKELVAVSKVPRSIRHICSIRHYYAQESETGEIDKGSLEDAFANNIESPYFHLLDRLAKNLASPVSVTGEEKALIAYFISTAFTRGPSYREGIKQFHERIAKYSAEILIDQQMDKGEVPSVVAEAIRKDGLWNTINMEIKEWVSLRPMLEMAHEGAEAMLQKKWRLFASPEDTPFVISDTPVVFTAREPYIGPFHRLSTIQAPLTSRVALYMSPFAGEQKGEIDVLALSSADVQNFNRLTIAAAQRHVYSPTKDDYILNLVKAYKEDVQRLTSA